MAAACFPAAQAKVQAELDAVIGSDRRKSPKPPVILLRLNFFLSFSFALPIPVNAAPTMAAMATPAIEWDR